MKWFRWYRGTSENPKFRLAARNGGVTLVTVMAVWQALLEDAAHPDHRGVCEKGEDFIAAALDLPDDGTVEGALRGLESVNLVSVGHGAITILNWQKWQYEQDVSDPSNAQRQKRYRDRKRAQSAQGTERNAGVTEDNAPESDTDTEKKDSARGGALDPAEFELWWECVPKKVQRKKASDKYTIARRKVSAETLLDGIKRYAAWCASSPPTEAQFIVGPAVWLHGERWADELVPKNGKPMPASVDLPGVPILPNTPQAQKWKAHYAPLKATDRNASVKWSMLNQDRVIREETEYPPDHTPMEAAE